jgi:hypothetical protein
MRLVLSIALALAALLLPSLAAEAQRARLPATRGGQIEAFSQRQQGEIMSLPEIRARVRVPGGEYVGVEFDGRIYRLKYMRGGELIWIDVDARTGQILNRR